MKFQYRSIKHLPQARVVVVGYLLFLEQVQVDHKRDLHLLRRVLAGPLTLLFLFQMTKDVYLGCCQILSSLFLHCHTGFPTLATCYSGVGDVFQRLLAYLLGLYYLWTQMVSVEDIIFTGAGRIHIEPKSGSSPNWSQCVVQVRFNNGHINSCILDVRKNLEDYSAFHS